MIFFTRELCNAYQPGSPRERQASNEWNRRLKVYRQYFNIIFKFLPKNLRKLERYSFHDCEIKSVKESKSNIVFILDTSNSVGFSPNYKIILKFKGIKNNPQVKKIIGQYWLYDEVHLSAEAAFDYHIFLDKEDIVISANDVEFVLRKK